MRAVTIVTLAVAAGGWAATWAVPHVWVAVVIMTLVGAYAGLWVSLEIDRP